MLTGSSNLVVIHPWFGCPLGIGVEPGERMGELGTTPEAEVLTFPERPCGVGELDMAFILP